MAGVVNPICPTVKAEYFSRDDWTGGITMKSLKKLAWARKTVGWVERSETHHHPTRD
jgi:hypothetical protein